MGNIKADLLRFLFLLIFIACSISGSTQTTNLLPVRTPYTLRLPVDKGSVYEMNIGAIAYVHNQTIVQIYPGETIFLEAEEKEGKLILTSVKEVTDPSKTVTVSCSQNVEDDKHQVVMIQVVNPFKKKLSYAARMFLLATNTWVTTNVLPVQPKLIGIEMWPDVVVSFGLGEWKLLH